MIDFTNYKYGTKFEMSLLNDEEVKELARRYYGNLKIGALLGENATEINEDIERRVFDFYVGYKTANGEKIPNKVFQPLNYLQSEQSAPEPSALPNKEWEIVSFVSIHGEVLTLDEKKWKYRSETSSISDMDFLLKHYSIHSVRRLSDNTVFSVGSQHFINGYMNTILRFELSDISKNIIVYFNGICVPYDLSKLPPTQPVVEDKPQSGLWVDINKGTIEEAKMLDKLWKQFKPIVLPLPKQKLNK